MDVIRNAADRDGFPFDITDDSAEIRVQVRPQTIGDRRMPPLGLKTMRYGNRVYVWLRFWSPLRGLEWGCAV